MLLTIDVGNTNIEFGFFEGDALRGSFRTMTKGNQTSDELGLSLCEYLEHFHWRTEDVEDVIIASVVPSIMYSLKSAMVKYLGRRPLVVNEDVFPTLGYLGGATTNDHGADRSVACMAAVEKYGAPLLVLWMPKGSMWGAASAPASGSAWTPWPRTPPCSPMWSSACLQGCWAMTRSPRSRLAS